MKVAILHNTLNATGGAERLCVASIGALKDAGHTVTLVSFDKTDWSFAQEAFGDIVKPDHEKQLFKRKIPYFGIYQRALSCLSLWYKKSNYDFIFNTHGDMLPVPCDLTYMYFPTFLLGDSAKYQRNLFWKLYFKPYRWMQKRLMDKYVKQGKILTCSTYSQTVIRNIVGRETEIVYPPVDIKRFSVHRHIPLNRRKDLVVTCARITPEKRLHLVPQLARMLPQVQFIIIGSTSAVSKSVIKDIMKEAEGLDNFMLISEFSLQKLLSFYAEAKVYLHTMKNEHFGIAVAEAMASGLIPVVHKSGGAWFDIVGEGKYGFGWETLEEAKRWIQHIISEGCTDFYSPKVDLNKFSKETYKKRIVEIVEKYK